MKVTLQNNYSYTYPVKKPVFQSASGDFGKAVGDVFQKETISETARNNLIDKLRLAIKEIIKPKNFMGRGFNGTVYQIDKNFAMKIKNYAKPSLETSDLVIKKEKYFQKLKNLLWRRSSTNWRLEDFEKSWQTHSCGSPS